jgi:branched-chain amino acid transport system substrate-binding protein
LEDYWMLKFMRWSAVLTATLLVTAACSTASPGASGSPGASAGGSVDAAALCADDPSGCVEVQQGDTIRLASSNTFSGPNLFLGLDVEYGVEIAVADRGSIKGHQVEIVKEDSGCSDPATGQTAAQSIASDDTIAGVIGTTCSTETVPTMPILAAKGITMISASNTAPALTDPNSDTFAGAFYFRTAYNDKVQGAAVAKYTCEQLKAKTAATIHDGSPYADQLAAVFRDDFASQCGGTITDKESYDPLTTTVFTSLLTSICATHPDVLFYPVFDPAGGAITLQVQQVSGCEKTKLFGADGIKDAGFIAQAGKLASQVGMYFSGPDLNFGDKYTNVFLPKYRALSGTKNPIAPYHAHGFDAANILMDAISHVSVVDAGGTLWIPRDAMRAYVANLKDYPGLTGNLTCDINGDCGSSFVSIAQLKPDAAGDLVFTEVYTTRSAS